MVTRLELETEVRDILDEPTAKHWTAAQLRRWLNEGLRVIGRETKQFKTTASITLTAGVAEYLTGTNVLSIEHAYYNDLSGRQVPLEPMHYEQMDRIWGDHRGQQGTWPYAFTTWGRPPSLYVRLFPVPSVTNHTLDMLVAVLPSPIAVTGGTDNDQVDVMPGWYDLLADYCEYKALRRNRDPEWQSARAEFATKLDSLVHNPDYLAVNREMVPVPGVGYHPRWLVEFD